MTRFKIAVILVLFTSLIFSTCNRHIAQSKEVKQYYYTCPMHSEVIEMKPGKCPKCGMTLEQWDMEHIPKKSGSSQIGNSNSEGHSGSCH